MTNLMKSQAAHEALSRYINQNADREDSVVDLLTDLQHYCKHNHLSFDRLLSLSRAYFEGETPYGSEPYSSLRN